MEQAADQLERFANRIKDQNVGDLARQAQDLARRRPALFIGSAFALGLLGARFLKSSNDDGYSQSRGFSASGTAYGDGGEAREGGYGGWTPATGSPAVTDAGRL